MTNRVRPQRLGNNQNYTQRNKERAFWMSSPLTHQNQKGNKTANEAIWMDSDAWVDAELWKD